MVTPHLVSSNSCTAQLEFAGAMTGSSARAQLSKSGAFLRLTILTVVTGVHKIPQLCQKPRGY